MIDFLTPAELADLMYNPTPGAVNNAQDVQGRLYACDKLYEEIERYKQLKKEAVEFYDQKIAALEKQIEFHRRSIKNYLVNTGQKNLATPRGTVYVTQKERVEWPSDDVLIDFSVKQGIPVRVKEIVSPDKVAIKKFIEDTHVRPDGLVTTTELTLGVKAPKRAADTSQAAPEEAQTWEVPDALAFL